MRVFIAFVLLLINFAAAAEDADTLHAQALPLLQKAMGGDEKSLVPAAKAMSKAAMLFEAAGNDAKAQDANACLFWLKKRMTLQQIGDYLKATGDDAEVAKKFEQIERKPPADEAQGYFDRAEAFARDNPTDALRISIRYFEVADRFVGSPVSIKAQQRSLEAMQQVKTSVIKLPAQNVNLQSIESISKAWTEMNSVFGKAKDKYIKELNTALKTETARGSLEGASQLQSELDLMASPVVSTTSILKNPSARNAQMVYVRQVETARRPYITTLRSEMANQVRKGNLELAKKIEEEINDDSLIFDYGWIVGTWETERLGPWIFTIEDKSIKLQEGKTGYRSKSIMLINGDLLIHWGNGDDAFLVSREKGDIMFSMYLSYFSGNPVKAEKPKGQPKTKMKMSKVK